MFGKVERLPDETYVEIVGRVYATLLPTLIMTAAFVGVGTRVAAAARDPALILLVALGALGAAARLAVLCVHRGEARGQALTLARAHLLERRFAVAYLAFALVLGLFAARAMSVAEGPRHLLVYGLLFGYGAGVAASLSLRPMIGIPSMVIAVAPTVAIMLAAPGVDDRGAAVLLAVFLAGGIQNMAARYRQAARNIAMRHLSATLARHDELTGLDNRLSLRERFDAFAAVADGMAMAVHCLDLDRFKPVNDLFGHATGDALLKAVADRLAGTLRRGDFAARTGGDEFIIVQAGARHPGEAATLAGRVLRTIAEPFSINDQQISIGVSIGYALSSDVGLNLDHLTACADDALYHAKRRGGGTAADHRELPPTRALIVA